MQDNGLHTLQKKNSVDTLYEVFGQQVKSRGMWPPRLPDLNPCDLFVGHAERKSVCEKSAFLGRTSRKY
jgi:hypothetical protein